GGMSRFSAYLSELAPDPFVEVSPELARLRGLTHGEWCTIISSRTAIEARALVTDRIKPLTIDGHEVHTLGLPYHWGDQGLATGDSANDLMPLVLDRNVHISEFKTATGDIQPGRRPRGPALREYVADYRRHAGVEEGI
ncbi:MAG: molybdopterin dinucleotide binding domain-containing protein, partial [Solirubrobacteraceae bacterium]